MTNQYQRRGFLRNGLTTEGVYAELDYVHQVLNSLNSPGGTRVFQDYQATPFDSRIYCLRPGLTIRLPVLSKDSDGFILFIQDRSGDVGADPITILPPTGQTINGYRSRIIIVNFDKVAVQWSFAEGNWFEVL